MKVMSAEYALLHVVIPSLAPLLSYWSSDVSLNGILVSGLHATSEYEPLAGKGFASATVVTG
jgi:hypothetical protein